MKKLISITSVLIALSIFLLACTQRESGIKEKQSSKASDFQSEKICEFESEASLDYEVLDDNEQNRPIISALEQVKIDWFNLSYGYPSYFKSFLTKDLVTVEISEGIDCYYAFFVLKTQYAIEFNCQNLGCAGEGYFDGYNFYSSQKDGNSIDGKWVQFKDLNKLPVEISIGEKEYKLDLCVAQKTVSCMESVTQNSILVQSASVYSRYPLKLDGNTLIEPNVSEHTTYADDQEVYSLSGKFVTAKPSEILEHYFFGDAISDEFFFKITDRDGLEWLDARFYHEDLEATRAFYLTTEYFSESQILALNGVFEMIDGELKVNFTLVKQYLENNG